MQLKVQSQPIKNTDIGLLDNCRIPSLSKMDTILSLPNKLNSALVSSKPMQNQLSSLSSSNSQYGI